MRDIFKILSFNIHAIIREPYIAKARPAFDYLTGTVNSLYLQVHIREFTYFLIIN